MSDNAVVVSSNDVPTKEWYGAPILVTDLAAFGLVATSLAGFYLAPNSDVGDVVAVAGLGAFVLGGPIVHLAENQPNRGFASLSLRVGAPLVGMVTGAYLGVAAYSGCGIDMCELAGIIWGGGLGIAGGMLTASVIDNALIAYKPVARKKWTFAVTPSYEPTTGQAGVLLHGTW